MPDLSVLNVSTERLMVLVLVPLVAHLLVILLRVVSARLASGLLIGREGFNTLFGLFASVLIFCLYFAAFGLVLQELGVSLTAYLASASVVGLAVAFGSQGVVQDVVTGVTLVLSSRINLGDMVEISGQTGIVKAVGMRFTVLESFLGAEVAIPNRTINNVVNYDRGYVRILVDVRLPADEEQAEVIMERAWAIVSSACEQLPGICRRPPSREAPQQTSVGVRWLRIKVRIWPGQAAPLENVRLELVDSLKAIDSSYSAWMVAVNAEVEPKDDV